MREPTRLIDEGANSVVGVQLYDLNNPRWTRKISLPPLKNFYPLGVLADGAILLVRNEANAPEITVTSLHLLNGIPRLKSNHLRAPSSGTVSALCPTSDGNHLAWLLFQGKIKARYGGDSPKQAALFISNRAGGNVRSLGTVPFGAASDEWNTVLHGWFPGDRRLLLEFRHQLFSVPVSVSG